MTPARTPTVSAMVAVAATAIPTAPPVLEVVCVTSERRQMTFSHSMVEKYKSLLYSLGALSAMAQHNNILQSNYEVLKYPPL